MYTIYKGIIQYNVYKMELHIMADKLFHTLVYYIYKGNI